LVLPLAELGPSLSYTTPADGLILPGEPGGLRAGRVRVRLLGGPSSFADNVVVAGCDPAIHIVDERLRRERAPGRLVAWPMGSLAALEALKRGDVHLAGLHVVDPASGESNVPFVRRHLGNAPVTLVTFASWEAGLLVARGNPKSLRGVGDLARRGVTLVNRESGAGARLLLDEKLREAGVPKARVRGYDDVVGSHLEVGRRVAEGRADAGVGVEAIARLLGLGFVPVRTERYDLVIPQALLDSHPGVARLLDALVSREVRSEVESLGGYDTSETGRRIVPLAAKAKASVRRSKPRQA
jgi:molybdate-binding protein